MTDCKNAEDLATFAREHGWDAVTEDDRIDGGSAVTLKLTGIWGEPDDLDWQWGIMLCWFKTEKSWRLGLDERRHPALGVAVGRDEVEHEFWCSSMRVVRRHIEDSAKLVEFFDKTWPKAKEGPTVETRVQNALRRVQR